MKAGSVQHAGLLFLIITSISMQAELVAGIDSGYSSKGCLPKVSEVKICLQLGFGKGVHCADQATAGFGKL
jgi:hypothetical protein